MQDQLASLAYQGQWDSVLSLLRQRPDLVNAASAGKGYTALHQAAWHGADVPVIGALLALGAAPRLMTSKHQTARDIACARHPERADLHYLLTPSARSLAQLLRKLIAEAPGWFGDYDGNRLICDHLIACLGVTWSEAEEPTAGEPGIEARLEAALHAITGTPLPPHAPAQITPPSIFTLPLPATSCASPVAIVARSCQPGRAHPVGATLDGARGPVRPAARHLGPARRPLPLDGDASNALSLRASGHA